MSYFDYLFNSQYAGTMWLYNLIFVATTACAFLSQKKNVDTDTFIFRIRWFALSFLIPWFFFVFTDTGADLVSYLEQYRNATLTTDYIFSNGMECGYKFIIGFLHSIIQNPYVGIGFLKTIQLLIIFYCIYALRDSVLIGFSVMAYMALYYYASFNVFRISFAGALILASYVLLIKNRKVRALIVCVSATLIHTSAYIFCVAIFVYYLYLIFKRVGNLYKLIIICAIPFIVFAGKDIVVSMLQSGLFFERYSGYVTGETTIGIMQVVFYLPLFYILFTWKDKPDKLNYDCAFIFTITGFAVALCGYSIGMLARTSIFFAGPFLFYLPQYAALQSFSVEKKGSITFFNLILIFYWVIRYILSMGSYFIVSGLYPFKFLF